MAKVPNGEKNIAKNFNRLSRVHKRYRQMTDGLAIAYSKREREFTFAKNARNTFVEQCISKICDSATETLQQHN